MRDLVLEDEASGEPSNNPNDDTDIREHGFRLEKVAREIVDLRKLLKDKILRNEVFCSFELFPSQKQEHVYQSFFSAMDKYSPLFYALTWHSKCLSNRHLSLQLVETFPTNTLLHIAGNGLNCADVENILKRALTHGITNVFALQGDSTITDGDFPYAVDLVTFIRNKFSDKFSICVAGYPETHPQSPSKELDLFYLKAKVDAGADFIITQIVFDADVFINFVKDCRKVGIDVPIIPGIFPIPNYKCLEKMANMCKLEIPKKVLNILRPMKNDDEATSRYGVELTTTIIKDILKSGVTCGFHLFTLNRTSLAVEICNRIGILH